MTMSPALELKRAVIARLRAFGPLAALVENRVWTVPPMNGPYPCVTLGPSDEVPDDATCIRAIELTFQVNAWSRDSTNPSTVMPGYGGVDEIAHQVRMALHEWLPVLENNAAVQIRHQQTRTFRDPDGLTYQAAQTYRAIIEIPVP